MDPKIGLDHNRVRPGIFNQLFLADDFAGAFHQSSQNVERATPDANRRIALQQQATIWKESKGAEGQHSLRIRAKPLWHSMLLYANLPPIVSEKQIIISQPIETITENLHKIFARLCAPVPPKFSLIYSRSDTAGLRIEGSAGTSCSGPRP